MKMLLWAWAAAGALTLIVAVALYRTLRGEHPRVKHAHHAVPRVRAALARLARLHYRAPIWASGWLSGHTQTAYCVIARRAPAHVFERREVPLADGGAASLDILARIDGTLAPLLPARTPCVLVVPGIAGSSKQHYVRALVAACARRGWRAAVFNHRGCDGEPLRSARIFTLGGHDDLLAALRVLASLYPQAPLAIVGFSMGGNVLCNLLADTHGVRIEAAVSICQAYCLRRAVKSLSSLYKRLLIEKVLSIVRRHRDLLEESGASVQLALEAKTAHAFDEVFTIPSYDNAWNDAEHYYEDASCLNRMGSIRTPTLLVNAIDDPLVPQRLVEQMEETVLSNPYLGALSTRIGGHIGFAHGWLLPSEESFADKITIDFLESVFSADETSKVDNNDDDDE